MVNKNLLYGKIKSKGLTCEICAEKIGITGHAFNQKANNLYEFKGNEIQTLISLLGITKNELMPIFFAKEVDK